MTGFHQRQTISTLTAPAAWGLSPRSLVQPDSRHAPCPATETIIGFYSDSYFSSYIWFTRLSITNYRLTQYNITILLLFCRKHAFAIVYRPMYYNRFRQIHCDTGIIVSCRGAQLQWKYPVPLPRRLYTGRFGRGVSPFWLFMSMGVAPWTEYFRIVWRFFHSGKQRETLECYACISIQGVIKLSKS